MYIRGVDFAICELYFSNFYQNKIKLPVAIMQRRQDCGLDVGVVGMESREWTETGNITYSWER